MKVPNLLKVSGKTLVIAMALNMTGFSYAISSTASNNIKDFKLVHSDGGTVRKSHVLKVFRDSYPDIAPKIIKKATARHPNCYSVKFIYKNELKRLTFNCASGRRQLTMLTR